MQPACPTLGPGGDDAASPSAVIVTQPCRPVPAAAPALDSPWRGRRRLARSLVLAAAVVFSQPGMGLAQSPACIGQAGGRQWTVGVVPQRPASQIVATWKPVLREVGLRSGQCFQLVVARSIPAFEEQLRSGRLDFAFLNPYHQVMAQRWQAFTPLVRDRELLEGLLVVRQGSGIRRLQDLQGTVVAFPAPNAFAASLLIRALLAREGIRITPDYVRTHTNVYRAVALGSRAAGGGVNQTLEQERPEVRRELRIIWRTSGYPAHPFSAAGRVPVAVRIRVQNALLQLAQQPAGRSLLAAVQLPAVVRADHGRDYAPLARLGLDRFVVSGDE